MYLPAAQRHGHKEGGMPGGGILGHLGPDVFPSMSNLKYFDIST